MTEQRKQFGEWYLKKFQQHAQFFGSIVWSDVATFKLNGRINRHNCIYWVTANPLFRHEPHVNLTRFSMLCSILSKILFEPFYFESIAYYYQQRIDQSSYNFRKGGKVIG